MSKSDHNTIFKKKHGFNFCNVKILKSKSARSINCSLFIQNSECYNFITPGMKYTWPTLRKQVREVNVVPTSTSSGSGMSSSSSKSPCLSIMWEVWSSMRSGWLLQVTFTSGLLSGEEWWWGPTPPPPTLSWDWRLSPPPVCRGVTVRHSSTFLWLSSFLSVSCNRDCPS